jgi:glycine/serine hydroxymethyltransferase
MKQIGKWISAVLKDPENTNLKASIHSSVKELCRQFPIY